MEGLLRWGIENSTPTDSGENAATPRRDLDPAIIDYILGKPDAVLMKEALELAIDENQSSDARIQALDDFEMLVENIDNANDLSKLKMWEPLQRLLTSPKSTESIKMQTLWVIGTAIQNNPSAQNDYLSTNPIFTILSFLSPSVESSQLRSKAVYALSSLCKHNAAAVQQLNDVGGWDVLLSALEDSDISVRRKTAFLINSLLIPSNTETDEARPSSNTGSSTSGSVHPNSHASMLKDPSSMSTSDITLKALEDLGLLKGLIKALTIPVPYGKDGESNGDIDFEEKVLQLLCTYLSLRSGEFPRGVITDSHVEQLRHYLNDQLDKTGSMEKFREVWSLSLEDMDYLRKVME